MNSSDWGDFYKLNACPKSHFIVALTRQNIVWLEGFRSLVRRDNLSPVFVGSKWREVAQY